MIISATLKAMSIKLINKNASKNMEVYYFKFYIYVFFTLNYIKKENCLTCNDWICASCGDNTFLSIVGDY